MQILRRRVPATNHRGPGKRRKQRVRLDHMDKLRNADAVSITFRKQKNRGDGTTITQYRNLSRGENELCPARALGEIVELIWEYVATTTAEWKETMINAFPREDNAGLIGITSKTVLQKGRQSRRSGGGETGLGRQQGGNPLH